mmetsp:Transcript_9751/g.29167  ORF Transcript_9751/g.29167 Transcript_9751/m.29167 type:complete len:409 (-) Transcript_9751:36-1262(-)
MSAQQAIDEAMNPKPFTCFPTYERPRGRMAPAVDDPAFYWGPGPKKVRPVPDFAKATTTEARGHSRNVNKVAWNGTGEFLASGSDDKCCRVWGGSDGTKCLHKLDHGDSVVQLCWDPATPSTLATLAADKAVRLWDVRDKGRATATIKCPWEYINISYALDGKHLAVGSSVGRKEEGVKDCVSLIEAASGKIVDRFKFTYEVNEFCWAPDAKHLMLSTANGTIEVLRAVGVTDPNAPKPPDLHAFGDPDDEDEPPYHEKAVWVSRAHTDDCYCVDLALTSPPLLAVGSKDSCVSIWDIEEMCSLRCVLRHTTPVRCVAFSKATPELPPQFVASSAYEPGIDIASVETTDLVHKIEANHAMNSLAWHPKKHVLAYAIDAKNDAGSSRRGRDDGPPPFVRLFACPEGTSA